MTSATDSPPRYNTTRTELAGGKSPKAPRAIKDEDEDEDDEDEVSHLDEVYLDDDIV